MSIPFIKSIFFLCLGCFTLGRNGHLVVWEPSFDLPDLQTSKDKDIKPVAKTDNKDQDEPDDVTETENNVESLTANESDNKSSKLYYSRKSKHFLRDALPKDPKGKKNSLFNLPIC